jgi:hypothetical protein
MVRDALRNKWLVLTPEEHVRQCLLQYLSGPAGYPGGRIAVERRVGTALRFDAVVYDDQLSPWMVIECKSPDVPVTDAVLHQLLRYHRSLQCRYWLLCNGLVTLCAEAGAEGPVWLDALPAYGS